MEMYFHIKDKKIQHFVVLYNDNPCDCPCYADHYYIAYEGNETRLQKLNIDLEAYKYPHFFMLCMKLVPESKIAEGLKQQKPLQFYGFNERDDPVPLNVTQLYERKTPIENYLDEYLSAMQRGTHILQMQNSFS